MKYICEFILFFSLFLFKSIEASFPECTSCDVYAIINDGVIWGWENENYCKFSPECNYSINDEEIHDETNEEEIINENTVYDTDTETIEEIYSTNTYDINFESIEEIEIKENNHDTQIKPIKMKKNRITSTTTTSLKTTTTLLKTTPSKETKTVRKTKTISKTSETNTNKETPEVPLNEIDDNGNFICSSCNITSTGSDGSLWGWENEKECIINKKKCIKDKLDPEEISSNNSESIIALDKVCSECIIRATGSDGVIWGWENGSACIIDKDLCNLNKVKTPERGEDGVLICSGCEYSEIDSDNIIWGYENGEKCRIIGSRCNINTTPYPWCSGCSVTTTGKDGSLWGIENEITCLINEINCNINNKKSISGIEMSSAFLRKSTNLYFIVITNIIIFIIKIIL